MREKEFQKYVWNEREWEWRTHRKQTTPSRERKKGKPGRRQISWVQTLSIKTDFVHDFCVLPASVSWVIFLTMEEVEVNVSLFYLLCISLLIFKITACDLLFLKRKMGDSRPFCVVKFFANTKEVEWISKRYLCFLILRSSNIMFICIFAKGLPTTCPEIVVWPWDSQTARKLYTHPVWWVNPYWLPSYAIWPWKGRKIRRSHQVFASNWEANFEMDCLAPCGSSVQRRLFSAV